MKSNTFAATLILLASLFIMLPKAFAGLGKPKPVFVNERTCTHAVMLDMLSNCNQIQRDKDRIICQNHACSLYTDCLHQQIMNDPIDIMDGLCLGLSSQNQPTTGSTPLSPR